MWNYTEIDEHITFEHLRLIMKWFEEIDTKTKLSSMLTSIERNGFKYVFHISNSGSGYERHFEIRNGIVTDMGIFNTWLS